MGYAAFDPIARLSWLARVRWRRAELRVRREFESDILAQLRQLAEEGAVVAWAGGADSDRSARGGGIVGPVEMSAGGRRIAARAVWGPAWSALSAAAAQGRVVLAGAGRYGGSWYLRFRVLSPEARTERDLPLLGAGLRIVPNRGGESGLVPGGSPQQPVFA
ncbi:MAG TPA: hypothetical protein VFV02_02590 [Acidimicrobiales bacterium]|nr:hypothetical protein [Acidimicrobiales bacterium]